MALRIDGEVHVMPLGPDRSKPRGPENDRSQSKRDTGDSVEISGAAKKLYEEGPAAAGETRQDAALDQNLIELKARIQERIAGGFYDSGEVLREVAKKILDIIGY
jgi:hypothetical protein